jgi:hypothetical protein
MPFDKLRANGVEMIPGDFQENLTALPYTVGGYFQKCRFREVYVQNSNILLRRIRFWNKEQ